MQQMVVRVLASNVQQEHIKISKDKQVVQNVQLEHIHHQEQQVVKHVRPEHIHHQEQQVVQIARPELSLLQGKLAAHHALQAITKIKLANQVAKNAVE